MVRRNKKKLKKLDIVVIGACVYFVAFVITAWVTFWVKGDVPDTLIQFGLGGGSVELVVSAVIEIMRDVAAKKMEKER